MSGHLDDARDGRESGSDGSDGATGMRQRLRTALTAAMKARDQVRVRALRDGLGAIDNAEAVDVPDRAPGAEVADDAASMQHSSPIAGARSGLGASEVARRSLSAERVRDVIRTQVDERRAAAEEYERAGAPDQAARLRDEADVLDAFLSS
jgi:uncharacterized protein YqeY